MLRLFRVYKALQRWLPQIQAGACALTLMVIFAHFEGGRRQTVRTRSALEFARQIAAQAETLSFYAQQKNERDPLSWVADLLSQGSEPRLIRALRVKGLSSFQGESHEWNGNEKFEYTKLLRPEDGQGIKFEIRQPYSGFLGTSNRWTDDLSRLLGLAVLHSLFLFGIFSRPTRSDQRLRGIVLKWILDFRAVLMQLGIQVRDVLKQASRILGAVSRAHSRLKPLQEKIVSAQGPLEALMSPSVELEERGQELEALALNVSLATSRLGSEAHPVAEKAEELFVAARKIRLLNSKIAEQVRLLEAELRELGPQTSATVLEFEELLKSSLALSQPVSLTQEALVNQAKTIEELKQQLSEPEPARKKMIGRGRR